MRVLCYTGQEMNGNPNRHARWLFDGIAGKYDVYADLYSFLQYGRWRRYLTSRMNLAARDTVLDLCTGTAGVAIQLSRSYGCRVVGVDLSGEMLRQAGHNVHRAGLEKDVHLLKGRAESLPIPDASLDAVCFTFLLRYVEDPQATLSEISRVLKPGGQMVSLEFGLPQNRIVRVAWYAFACRVLPIATRFVSPGWREVGTFLGPSISRYCRFYTVERIQQMWEQVGVRDVQAKVLSLGGAVVMWGTKSPETGT